MVQPCCSSAKAADVIGCEAVLPLTARCHVSHGMQALMLPEAVRLLDLLVTNGKRVYVHCTAGINRATLTTVGYLTFVKVCCYVPKLLGFASLPKLSDACVILPLLAIFGAKQYCNLAKKTLCITCVAMLFVCIMLLGQHSHGGPC